MCLAGCWPISVSISTHHNHTHAQDTCLFHKFLCCRAKRKYAPNFHTGKHKTAARTSRARTVRVPHNDDSLLHSFWMHQLCLCVTPSLFGCFVLPGMLPMQDAANSEHLILDFTHSFIHVNAKKTGCI